MKKETLEKAKAGDVEAMFRLAGCLYAGRGAAQSYALARDWYEAAAEGGHAKAKYELGLMIVSGLGLKNGSTVTEADLTCAAELFKEAADADVNEAKFELGAMYALGRGVKKNYVKAMKLLRESRTYESTALLAEAPKWWEAPAKQGIAEAQFQYGLCYMNGYGLPQDYVTGRYWLLKAALQDNAKAYDAMAQIYIYGLGVPMSKEKALYFRKRYCDIKGEDYGEYGVTGDETIDPDELDPEKIELPKYAATEEPPAEQQATYGKSLYAKKK